MLAVRLYPTASGAVGIRLLSTTPVSMKKVDLSEGGLQGNGVIGIRREDKNQWERRVPLTPKHVRRLVEDEELTVLVQPSSIRAYVDEEYVEAGAIISEDLSPASTIVAVKEVPVDLLIPERTYMMFSHTHKAQPYNMPLLDAILAKKIRLIDFERIAGEDGRLVKFGPFAGFAGMIDTLHALGVALLQRHFATPFLFISHAKEYRSLDTARQDLIELGNYIRKRGLPREIGPLTFVITGTGSVSQAAQQILHHLPCQYISAPNLKKLASRKNFDNKTIYVTVVDAGDMVAPKDRSKRFSKQEYYENPADFVPTFHEEVAPYAKVIVNGMYWEAKYPRLLTIDQTRQLHHENRFPCLVVGEITCDPYGSIEFFSKSTSIAHPLYAYDPSLNEAVDLPEWEGRGPIIVGVDHLPAEFPKESSEFFGDPLVSLVAKVAKSNGALPIEKQADELPAEICNGIIASGGSLTPSYKYIDDLRAKRRESAKVTEQRNILFLGAGMVSGPAVEYLLNDPRNSVTVADQNIKQAETLLAHYAKKAKDIGRDAEGRNQAARAVTLDVSHTDNLSNLISSHDIVVSLVPWHMHPMVMDLCIKADVPCVTASYVTPKIQELHGAAVDAGVTLVNEMGLDPGIDIMSSLQMLDKIRKSGGVVRSYESYCGALPEPESARNCLGYKFSWSPRGVLVAVQRPCKFKWNNKIIDLEGKYLYDVAQDFNPFPGLNMDWVPNGNSLDYSGVYGLGDEAHTVVRATLRYKGFAAVARGLRELGIVNAETLHEALDPKSTVHASWLSLIGNLAGLSGDPQEVKVSGLPEFLAQRLAAKRDEIANMEQLKGFYSGSELPPLDKEVSAVMSALQELTLLDETKLAKKVKSGAVIDSLAGMLENELKYDAGEQDFVLMYHRFIADFEHEGKTKVFESSLAARGSSHASATATTVGLPCGIAVQLVLNGVITKPGVVRPITDDVYNPVMMELRRCGIAMKEGERVLGPLATNA